jgi:hypothetical protein
MPDADSLFREALPLADKISSDYANVPGMTADDVRAVAHDLPEPSVQRTLRSKALHELHSLQGHPLHE